MQMNPVVTFALSVMCGGAAILGARFLMSDGPEEPVVEVAAKVQMRDVLIAVRGVPRGVAVEKAWFEVEERPVTDVPRGAFESFSELEQTGVGRRTLIEMEAGDILSEKLLLAPGMRASLSAKIEPGMRAFTIRASDVKGVGGFVLPGDKVDVIFIERRAVDILVDDKQAPLSREVSPVSEVLLQNVEVLAVDLNDDMIGNRPDVFKTATLAVSLEQAQKLSVATEIGELSLALRGSADEAFEQAEAVSLREKPKQVAQSHPRPRPLQSRSSSSTVQVILGEATTTHTVPSSNQ